MAMATVTVTARLKDEIQQIDLSQNYLRLKHRECVLKAKRTGKRRA
jgi:hypothetical protein